LDVFTQSYGPPKLWQSQLWEFRDSHLGVPGQNDIWVLVSWPSTKSYILKQTWCLSVCLSCRAGQGRAGKQGRGRAGRPNIFSYAENNGFLAAIRIWEFQSPPLPPRCCCCADSWQDLSVTNFYRKKQMQKMRFLLCAWVPNRRIVVAWYVCSFENFIAVGTHHVVNLCVIWRTQLWH
jgi:hypothetical protein